MYTTLNKIRAHDPCSDGWKKLLAHLGKTKADDESVSFLTILKSNGLGDALWCLRSTPEYNRDSRLFAVWSARQVQHLMTDPRSIEALDVAERYANGQATEEERAAASGAAWAAARDAAWAARDAARAARDASAAARDAPGAASAAARDASAASAASAVAWAASGAASAAARDAVRDAQLEMFIKMCKGEAPWQQ